MKASALFAGISQAWQSIFIVCVVSLLRGISWSMESETVRDDLHALLRSCAAIAHIGDRYRLSMTKEGHILHDTRVNEGGHIPIPGTWFEPLDVKQNEEDDYVSSLNWSEPVQDFDIGWSARALHLSSYQVQESGSAQMAAGRDIFLVLERDGTIYPGLIDLGVTQERGRVHGQWFARSHRFIKADVNGDRLNDLAVVEDEVPLNLNTEGIPEGGTPTVIEHSIRWYVYQPSSHAWVHKPKFDGRLEAGGCPRMLPLTGMVMTPVDFVKQMYRLK